MKHVLIVDLDNCIFPTNSMGANFLETVLAPLHGNYDAATIARIHRDLWCMALPDVVAAHVLPREIVSEMQQAFTRLSIPEHIHPYPDVCPAFEQLHRLQDHLYCVLVTKGYRATQEQKIAHLGIGWFFHEMVIVGIDSPHKTKEAAFRDTLTHAGCAAEHTSILGDGQEEIEAGNALGCRTIQLLRPEVARLPVAQYHINTFLELVPMFD